MGRYIIQVLIMNRNYTLVGIVFLKFKEDVMNLFDVKKCDAVPFSAVKINATFKPLLRNLS